MRFPCSGPFRPSSSLCPSVFVRIEASIEEIGPKRTKSMVDGGEGESKEAILRLLFYLQATNEHSVNVLLDVEGMFSIPLDSACTNYRN